MTPSCRSTRPRVRSARSDEGAVDGAAHLLQVGRRVGEFRAQPVALVGHHLALPDEVLWRSASRVVSRSWSAVRAQAR